MFRLSRTATPRLRMAPARVRSVAVQQQSRDMAAMSQGEAVLAFRRFGHLLADIDPLGRREIVEDASNMLRDAFECLTPDMAALMKRTYCGRIGIEFAHIEDSSERGWWAQQLETAAMEGVQASLAEKRNAVVQALKADTFELFLGKKFPGFKRYSGEGTEGVLIASELLFQSAARAGVADIVVGEAHRGRLAMLTCLLDYPARKLLWKIQGNDDFPAGVQGVDDVSSHVYTSVVKTFPAAAGGAGPASVRVSLLPNPSHLEAVNPVAAGKVRAKRDTGASPNALCLLIHGDAACSGQGIVAESYAMANLPGYSVGGTIHVIANNQIGYTAEGLNAGRSSRYASDMSKIIGCPVLHVNGESVPDLVHATRLAVAYRQRFGKDVVLDIIGYRRHGHNEVDEPSFTNPAMYKAVRSRPSFAESYGQALVAAGDMSDTTVKSLRGKLEAHLEAEFVASKTFNAEGGSVGAGVPNGQPGSHVVADGIAFGGLWSGMRQASPQELLVQPATGVDTALLRHVAGASVAVPTGFQVHDRLMRSHVKPRLELSSSSSSIGETTPAVDWSTAEAMAIGTVLNDGVPVRMSGQDVERGTFSQRHAVLVDQATGAKHCPLAHMQAAPGTASAPAVRPFYPVSSLLSELAVMGFELGYTWDSPAALVCWEAQFGDFANGAQIIIDQFLSGSESKWLRQTGLTLLLPHGYDGAGPEHSSGRIERFLQLVNSQAWARSSSAAFAGEEKDKCVTEALNMRVAVPTTPANYFHLLRRQVATPWRKPLVVFTPKALLRAAAAMSSLADMGPGTSFQPVLDDVWPCGTEAVQATGAGAKQFAFDSRNGATAAAVQRVLLCSGKIYHELAKKRSEVVAAGGAGASRAATTAIIRVEELAPWPADVIQQRLASFPGLKEVAWVQEEPANAGAYTWAEAHMTPVLASLAESHGLTQGSTLPYIGRPALPTPAVGLGKRNKAQQEALLAAAFPA